jgi:hypothetical protein
LPAGIAAVVTDRGLAQVREAVLAEAIRLPFPLAPSGTGSGWALTSILLHPVSLMLALVAALSIASLALPTTNAPSAALPRVELSTLNPGAPGPVEATGSARAPIDAEPATESLASDEEGGDGDEEATNLPTVTGRILLASGEPALGATVDWNYSLYPEGMRGAGEVEQAPVTVDAEGRFVLASQVNESQIVRARVHYGDHPVVRLGFNVMLSSPHVDIGDVRLSELGSVRVQVRRPDGSTLADGSRFVCDLEDRWVAHPRFQSKSRKRGVLDAQGFVLLENVPAGPGTLELRVLGRNEVLTKSDVFVVADASADTELVFDEATFDARVRVLIWSEHGIHVPGRPESAVLRLADGTELIGAEHGGNGFLFESVPEGDHTLVVDDPACAPAIVDGVRAGDEVRVDLVGGCQVRLSVFDESGSRLTNYRAWIQVPRTSSGMDHDIRGHATETSTHELYPQVAAREQTWVVAAEGHPTRRLELTGLTRGEVRDVEVHLIPLAPITGTVVDTDGTPLPGVTVEVRRRSDTGTSFKHSPPLGLDPDPADRQRLRHEPDPLATDAEGRFSFGGLVDGEYEVLAHRSRWNYVLVESCAAGDDLELTLAASRTIAGRVLGATAEQLMELELALNGSDLNPLRERPRRAGWNTYSRPSDIKGDGTFTFEHVPTSALRLDLEYPQQPASESRATNVSASFAAVTTLEPGSEPITDLEVLLDSVLPCFVEAKATVDGTDGWGLVLEGRQAIPGSSYGAHSIHIAFDKSGEIHSAWLPPGEWNFRVVDRSDAWAVPIPGVHTVASGESLDLNATVSTFPGSVLVTDLDGEPLAERNVQIQWTDNLHRTFGAIHTTDADGLLELRLPLGTYDFALKPEEDDPLQWRSGPRVEFSWSTAGPLVPSVALGEPED